MPKGNNQKVISTDFDIGQVAVLTGLHRADVQKLVIWKLVSPSARPNPGRGGPAHARRFAPADVQRLRVIAPLYQAGMPPRYIKRVLELLERHQIALPRDGALIVDGTRAFLVDEAHQSFDVLRAFQGAFYLFLNIDPPPRQAPGGREPAKVGRIRRLAPLELVPSQARRAGTR